MIAIILVNWNGCDLTLQCVHSIKQSSLQPDWIIIVDNGSVDNSAAIIKKNYPDVIIIKNKKNVGFGEANNIGARKAIQLGADYVWLLNNDTYIADDCLSKLLSAAELRPGAACYTSKIYYEKPPDMLWYDGGDWHPLHKGARHINQKKIDINQQDNTIVFTEYISGCSMFIPVVILKKYGLFCRDYIAYSEDADFCLRLRRDHQALCYVRGARIWHKVSASLLKNCKSSKSNGVPPYGLYLMVRNNFWTIRRNNALLPSIPILSLHVGITLKIGILYCLKRDWPKIRLLIKALLQGLFFPLHKLSSTSLK